MPSNEAGSVYLGLKLKDDEFLRQISQISKKASVHLQKQIASGLTMPRGAFDFSGVNKEIEAMSDNIAQLIRDQTGAIDGLADYLKSCLSAGVEEALENTGSKAERAINNVKLPKIKAEYDEESLKAMADNLGQQLDLADAKARTLKKTMQDAQNELRSKQASWAEMTKTSRPDLSGDQLLAGFNAEPFEKAIDEATTKFLKADEAAQKLGIKLQAVNNEIKKIEDAKVEQPIDQAKLSSDRLQASLESATQKVVSAGKEALGLNRALGQSSGTLKIPKIIDPSNRDDANAMVQNLKDQINQTRAQAFKSKQAITEAGQQMAEARAQFIQTQKAIKPDADIGEMLKNFDSQPFEQAMSEAQARVTKLNERTITLNSRLTELRAKMHGSGAETKQTSRANKILSDSISQANKNFKTLGQSTKKTNAELSQVNKASKKAHKGLKRVTMVGLAMFGIRSALSAVRKMVLSVGESLGRMAMTNNGLRKSLDGLTAAGDRAKGAFGAMAAPLLQAVAPALETVLNYAAKAFNEIAKFIGALTGMKSVQIATGSTKKFAGNMANAAGSAKEIKRTLAGFDELQILTPQRSSGEGGGAGAGQEPGVKFESVDTGLGNWQSKWQSFVDGIKQDKAFATFAASAQKSWNDIKESGETAWNKIKKAWDNNLPTYKESFGHLGAELKGSVSGLASHVWLPMTTGAIKTGIDVGGKLGEGIISVGAKGSELADKALSPFLGSVNQFWDEHGPEVEEKITGTWDDVSTGITGVLDGIEFTFNEVFGGLIKWFDENGEDIKATFTETWETAWGIIEPIWTEIGRIGKIIFQKLADFFYEMAPKVKNVVVNAVDLAWRIIKPIWLTILNVAKVIFGKLKAFWDTWGDDILSVFGVVWNQVKLIFGTTFDILSGLFGAFSALFSGDWNGFLEGLKGVLKTAMNFFKKSFKNAFDFVSKIFGFFGLDLEQIWGDIKGVFDGIIKFVTNVFQGNWEEAWEGVKEIFGSIFDALKALFVTPINWIIDGINWFIRQLNKIQIPDWVPLVGGMGINIQEIEPIALAKGGIVDQPTLSMIGEAGQEAVVPLERNTGWIDQLVKKLAEAGGGGGETHVTIPVSIGEGNLMDVIEVHFDRQGRIRNETAFA